jgi:hypothetical protein
MGRLKSASLEAVSPDTVEDRWIDFGDGLETTAGLQRRCSADCRAEGHQASSQSGLHRASLASHQSK